jgi:hypothetical protein
MEYFANLITKLCDIAYNIFFVVIAPALLVVLFTRKIVIDAKNKIITLNK